MRIQYKLFLIFSSFSLVLVIMMVLLIQWSLSKGMMDYVNNKELSALSTLFPELVAKYESTGNWNDLEGRHRRFQRMLNEHLYGTEFQRPPRPERRAKRPPPERRREGDARYRRPPPHDPANRPPRESPVSYALLDKNKALIVGDFQPTREFYFQPLYSEEALIGYFAISKRHQLVEDYELDFIAEQQTFLWGIALVVMVMVLVVTLPLARHFTKPIEQFLAGMHKLTHGDYQQTMAVSRRDEFAALARDFNELAKTLAENEHARRRWLANISHELRTPVAILRGELEAILDGIRRLSLDQVNSAHTEVLHLERLITDLHALTSADIGGMSYRKAKMDLVEFLQQESLKLASYLRGSKLKLHVDIAKQPIWIYADETRLCQLLENLIANCVKYAADGSQVSIIAHKAGKEKCVTLRIEDDGQGVEERHLPHLFEHLYRVDSSRNRKTGGTGLGLSICSHIVAAHNGQISAERSTFGGLAIIIKFPLIENWEKYE